MSINFKLRLIFAFILCFIFFFSISTNNLIKFLDNNLKSLKNNKFPVFINSYNIDETSSDYSNLIYQYILAKEDKIKQGVKSDLHSKEIKFKKDFEELLKKVISNDENNKLAEINKNWTKYLDITNRILNSTSYDQAQSILFNEAIPAFDKFINLIDDFMTLQQKLVNDNIDSSNIYSNSEYKMACIHIIGTILLLFLMIIFIKKVVLDNLILFNIAVIELSNGNTNIEIKGKNRKDELGIMANGLESFRNSLVEKSQFELKKLQLEEQSKLEREQTKLALIKNFEVSVQSIVNSVSKASAQLFFSIENMQKNIANVNIESSNMSDSSSQAASNVVNVASAVEEMSVSIKEVSTQASKTSSLMNETVTKSSQANISVEQLGKEVTQISTILEMIDGIAKQINLLALNATIESARAGEAGKGFSVVASEIKALADQTAKATETISKQINNINKVSFSVADDLAKIQDAIKNVSQYAISIASAVEEQSIATNEISKNLQNTSMGVQSISYGVAEISRGASSADSSAKEILNASQTLSNMSEELNKQVSIFLEGVREY